MAVRRAIASVIAAAGALTTVGPMRSGVARADGAFPTSLQILLPADRSQEIAAATNFGLILSEDGGATWQWTCEQTQIFGASRYAVGPSPQDRYFAMSGTMGLLAFSDDVSCTWTPASGALTEAAVTDYFLDGSNASRVLAVGTVQSGGVSTDHLYASADGGATFGAAIYSAPASGVLAGVEIARSDPMTVYLAVYTTTQTTVEGGVVYIYHPSLVRSADGGATWATTNLEPMLGQVRALIMAVDPADARKIYLRIEDDRKNQESVAISNDAGATFASPVAVPGGVLTAFARLASGTVLVGAEANTVALGYPGPAYRTCRPSPSAPARCTSPPRTTPTAGRWASPPTKA